MNESNAPSTVNTSATLSKRHIRALWEHMARVYGTRWTSNYGTEDDGTWFGGLADLAPDDLKAGFRRCIESGTDWPPSLPTFRAYCTERAPTPPRCHREFPPELPAPRNVATAEKHIARLREVLR